GQCECCNCWRRRCRHPVGRDPDYYDKRADLAAYGNPAVNDRTPLPVWERPFPMRWLACLVCVAWSAALSAEPPVRSLREMLRRSDPLKVKLRGGFSLLDLKRDGRRGARATSPTVERDAFIPRAPRNHLHM